MDETPFRTAHRDARTRASPPAARRGAGPSPRAMADDEWSALDEELEKALSGKKGKKGKRDSVLSSARATDRSGSSATGSEPAKLNGTKSLDDPSAVASDASVPPAATARDPALAPNETLDEWSALDEELEKLERGKKRRGVKNDDGGVGVSVGVGVGAAAAAAEATPKPTPTPTPPPTPTPTLTPVAASRRRRRRRRRPFNF